MKLKAARFRQAIVDYWDLMLAVAGALAVATLGVIGKIDTEALTTATLAVLAALTGVTFRERYDRRKQVAESHELAEAVRDQRPWRELDETIREALSNKPWHVHEERLSWDITTSRDATVHDHRILRFLDSESVAVWEFFSGPPGGKVVDHKCEGGPVGVQKLRDWPVMKETFMADANRRYRVVSTNGIWRRGDRVSWKSTRRLRDFFPETEEGVTKTVLMPTDQLTMQVTWPKGMPPTNVRMCRDNAPDRYLSPQIDADGRKLVREDLGKVAIGEVINIRWDWR